MLFGSPNRCCSTGLIELPLQHVVGEEFVLQYGALAFGGHFGEGFMDGDLSFQGLPEGYTVVSCSGYPSTVAIQPTSWSLFKLHYR